MPPVWSQRYTDKLKEKNHRIAIVHFSVFVLRNVEKLNLPQLQENQIEAIKMKPVAQLSCHQVD